MATLQANQCTSLLESLKNTCRLFWGPDRELCRDLREGSYVGKLKDLDPLTATLRERRRALEAGLRSCPDDQRLLETLEEEYVPLFITRRGGVKTPLYHSCYTAKRAPLMGPPALMMVERLRAAGLNLAEDLHEPPDHVAIEGEYVYFLLERGWRERSLPDLEEAGAFVEKEMLPWVRVFMAKLEQEPEGVFYTLFAGILCDLLQIIAGRVFERTGPY